MFIHCFVSDIEQALRHTIEILVLSSLTSVG
jgi:hypothetical protein